VGSVLETVQSCLGKTSLAPLLFSPWQQSIGHVSSGHVASAPALPECGAGVLSRDRSESSAFRRWSSSVAVNLPMTLIAERDQVSLAVVPGMTAQLFLMDVNVTLRATQLPGPSVPTEHAAADHGIPSLLTAVAWAG
jgi:hypothetical protein